jgi:hypothetical protein
MAKPDNNDAEYKELSHEFFDRFSEEDVIYKFRFKRPSTPQSNRVQKSAMKNAGSAFRNLIMECVHPDDKSKLSEALGKYPGLATTFGGGLMGSVGFGELGN